MTEPKTQAENARQAFTLDYERFAALDAADLSLSDAENFQRQLAELRVKHTGKKSEIAGLKKLIGQVAPEERGAFGKLIQSIETEVGESLTNAKRRKSNAKKST
jgi:phenylalanyl-tRNA synthetase alpha subunit